MPPFQPISLCPAGQTRPTIRRGSGLPGCSLDHRRSCRSEAMRAASPMARARTGWTRCRPGGRAPGAA